MGLELFRAQQVATFYFPEIFRYVHYITIFKAKLILGHDHIDTQLNEKISNATIENEHFGANFGDESMLRNAGHSFCTCKYTCHIFWPPPFRFCKVFSRLVLR